MRDLTQEKARLVLLEKIAIAEQAAGFTACRARSQATEEGLRRYLKWIERKVQVAQDKENLYG